MKISNLTEFNISDVLRRIIMSVKSWVLNLSTWVTAYGDEGRILNYLWTSGIVESESGIMNEAVLLEKTTRMKTVRMIHASAEFAKWYSLLAKSNKVDVELFFRDYGLMNAVQYKNTWLGTAINPEFYHIKNISSRELGFHAAFIYLPKSHGRIVNAIIKPKILLASEHKFSSKRAIKTLFHEYIHFCQYKHTNVLQGTSSVHTGGWERMPSEQEAVMGQWFYEALNEIRAAETKLAAESIARFYGWTPNAEEFIENFRTKMRGGSNDINAISAFGRYWYSSMRQLHDDITNEINGKPV